MRVQIDRATGRIHLHIPGLGTPSQPPPARGRSELASPPVGGIEGGRTATNQNHGRDLNSWPGHVDLAITDDTLAQLKALQAINEGNSRAVASLEQFLAGVAPPPRPGLRVPRSVAERARALLAQNPLILDYETTGIRRSIQVEETAGGDYPTTATATYHQVIEVAVLDGTGRNLFHSWVNPQRSIPDRAKAVHGLAAELVASAPTWAEVAPMLRRVLANRLVVAHYAAFEALFTPPQWEITWGCTKDLCDAAFGLPDHSEARDAHYGGGLQARLWQCGLPPGLAHTAAGDCLSTLRLLRFLAGYEQNC